MRAAGEDTSQPIALGLMLHACDAVYFLEKALTAGGAVSTAGLRKPAGELYPARAMLDMAVEAGVPIALSSDAHVPDHLAHRYDEALELLESAGVSEIAVFERRQRRLEPLG